MTDHDWEMPKYSTERLSEELMLLVTQVEGLRQTLVWMIEVLIAEEPQAPCATCGHDAYDHVNDDAESGACGFPRTLHGVSRTAPITAPIVMCSCQQFT